ncbi:NAD-dependent epimerase/dehydratase family protein [bacterium]|nr:NAD-dependent epimerase/dehydratase family protein [bacterium]NBX49356.1 NAD-dependent epimerase/dehydratase family protein [bacterium]
MASIIVTGGAGFIGSHIVDALIARGDEVTVIDIAPPHPLWGNTAATYIQRDIRDEHLADVCIDVRPEAVIHLAAHVDDRVSVIEPVENADHNIIGTINVLDAARVAGAKRVVFASTGVTYGEQENIPISEDAICRPLTPYAVSKLTGERYLRYFSLQLGLSGCALRLANVYGPRQDGSKECGAIAIFTKKLLQGERPFINGTGETTRDYVHVADVTRAFLLALESTEETVMNVGTGKETTTKKIFDLVAQAVGGNASALSRPEVTDAVARIALSAKKAEQVLGWRPERGIEQGIQETVQWYKAQGRA